MRLVTLIPAVAVLIVSGTGFAQTWIEYVSLESRVAINFPGEPMVQDVSYTTVNGASVPARVFSVESGAGRFVLTAVDFTASEVEEQQAIEHAAGVLRQKGETLLEAAEDLDDGIPGRQLSIAEEDGRRMLASIYMYDRRLYIAEGSGALGATLPVQFSQSIVLLDANGNEVNPNPGGNR